MSKSQRAVNVEVRLSGGFLPIIQTLARYLDVNTEWACRFIIGRALAGKSSLEILDAINTATIDRG